MKIPSHRWFLGALLAAALPLAGCSRSQVAVVGGEAIPERDYQAALFAQTSSQQLLRSMIEAKLLVLEAADQGVPVTDDQLNRRLELFKTQSGPPGSPMPYDTLRQQKLSDEWIAQWVVAPDVALGNLALKEYGSQVKPADVRRFYEANKAFLEKPLRYKVRVVTFRDEKKAKQAEEILNKGGSFDTAAKQSDLPPTPMVLEANQPDVPPELMAAISRTPVGKATTTIPFRPPGASPTSPPSFWALAVVDSQIPPTKMRLDDPSTKRMLETQLVFQEKAPGGAQMYRQKVLEQARKDNPVTVIPEPLKAVENAPAPSMMPTGPTGP